jgi:hypothetical protein
MERRLLAAIICCDNQTVIANGVWLWIGKFLSRDRGMRVAGGKPYGLPSQDSQEYAT